MHLLTRKSSLPVNMQFKLLNVKIQSLIKYTNKRPALLSCLSHTVQVWTAWATEQGGNW